MAIRKKTVLITLLSVSIAILIYVIFSFYTNSQLLRKLPENPSLTIKTGALKKSVDNAYNAVLDNPTSKNIGELAMIFHANNFFDEAQLCYELAIKKNSKNWKWPYYLGCLQRELGNADGVVLNFENVLDLNPKSYMALYYLGEGYQQLNAIKKAEQILRQLSGMNTSQFIYSNSKRTSYFPLPLYARLELAKLYANSSRFELAIKELKGLISSHITFGPAYRQLSNLYAQGGNLELSKHYSQRSNDLNIYVSPVDTLIDELSLKSKSETYLLKQIDDAIRSSNSHWALELINLGLASDINSKYLESKAMKHYIDMNATKNAIPLIDRHLEAFKDNYQELIEVGVGLANKGFKNEALRYFAIAEKVSGIDPSAKATLAGMYYEKLGLKKKAFELLDTLLETYPDNSEVKSAAVFLFFQIGDKVRAKKQLNDLKIMQPNHKDISVFKGILAGKRGDLNAELNYYEKALKDNPDKKFIINHLKDYYNKKEAWQKAINLYEIVLNDNPNDSDIQEAYGSLLLNCPDKSLRNLNFAKEYSERAFINKTYTLPTKLQAGRTYAIALFELKEHGKAIYYMNKTIEIAKRAGANKQYVLELERILNDFRRLSS